MDPTKFDELTKVLATSTSRRQALKTIAATTLGSILGLGGIGTAFGAPKCHRQGTGCDTTSQCCSGLICQNGKCVPCTANGGTCRGSSDCCSGNCSQGQCCQTGLTNCSGTCTNTQTDANNCGSCGHTCRPDQVCSGGSCICPAGSIECSGACYAGDYICCPGGVVCNNIPGENCCTSDFNCLAGGSCYNGCCG